MSWDWADITAQQLLQQGLLQSGLCLILGGTDTGKTTLAAGLAKYAGGMPVGIVDADIGQSHIGPPTTVGWALADKSDADFSKLEVRGISFVGDITPPGHLLQLTAAIAKCVKDASESTKLVIIDTPGFVSGPAAAALWWEVQRMLLPQTILAVQHGDELSHILAGLGGFDVRLETVKPPTEIAIKSPQQRRAYRLSQFSRYFSDSQIHSIKLSETALQCTFHLRPATIIGRVVALRDARGTDKAIGLIQDWRPDEDVVMVRAPAVDKSRIRCLVIGDASVDDADISNPPGG